MNLRSRVGRIAALAAAVLAAAATGFGVRALTTADAAPAAASTRPTSGLVEISVSLGYQGGAAEGTGILLGRSGEVLTNNHVIRGATGIRVRVPAGGRTYRATVAGYDVAHDVAVLALRGASGLTSAPLGHSSSAKVGERVRAVGNAGGTGTLTITSGRITALGRTITAGDENGRSQRLAGLIQTDAELEPGDSGGALLDPSGHVIGMLAAASTGFSFTTSGTEGYAIPIDRALSIVRQIETRTGTATVHVGATAFLGVDVRELRSFPGTSSSGGALIAAVVPSSPSDRAGLSAGDVITALDGHRVAGPSALTSLLLGRKPGATVRISWIDELGNAQTGRVTLASGPPQ